MVDNAHRFFALSHRTVLYCTFVLGRLLQKGQIHRAAAAQEVSHISGREQLHQMRRNNSAQTSAHQAVWVWVWGARGGGHSAT